MPAVDTTAAPPAAMPPDLGDRLAPLARPYRSLLPSPPIPLAAAGATGDLGLLSVVYDQARCLGWDEARDGVCGALDREIETLKQTMQAALSEHNATWAPLLAAQEQAQGDIRAMLARVADATTAGPGEDAAALMGRWERARALLTDPQDAPPTDPFDAAQAQAFLDATLGLAGRIRETQAALTDLRTRRDLAIIAWAVIGLGVVDTRKGPRGTPEDVLTWPFTDPPSAPDPAVPASWAIFPVPALTWIASDGLAAAAEAARSPLFGYRSPRS